MNDDFDMQEFEMRMKHINKHHDQLDQEFGKLYLNMPDKLPRLNDRVVVATGLIGMGHIWVRKEAVVIECGNTSYKVRFTDEIDYATRKPKEVWINQTLITDVLPPVGGS